MAANTQIEKGLVTVTWGTKGALGSTLAAIAESVSVTPKNQGPIADIEDGNGATATMVYLDDGFSARVTCIHDWSLTWPALFSAVNLILPNAPGTGSTGSTFACTLSSITPSLTRKKEATIELMLEYRPGVTS